MASANAISSKRIVARMLASRSEGAIREVLLLWRISVLEVSDGGGRDIGTRVSGNEACHRAFEDARILSLERGELAARRVLATVLAAQCDYIVQGAFNAWRATLSSSYR